MASIRERTPREQATLIHETPEQGQELAEGVQERLRQEADGGRARGREVVGAAVAEEFAAEGESVETVREPWEHTPAEHEEVQALADLAFAKDLPAALQQARKSEHYPRNVDLLHDVLTGELYDLLREHALHRQPLLGRGLVLAGVGLLALVVIVLLWLS